jgi:hypothetical protein
MQKPMEPYIERLSEEGSLRSLRSPEDEDTRQENGHSKADSETIATSSLPRSHDTSYATVADFFSNPPDWFVSQREVYRRNPTRQLPPLCAAVAAEVLGNGLRGDEVCEAVERELA